MTSIRPQNGRNGRAVAETIAGVAVIVVALISLALQSWLVMLIIGAVHGVAAGVPAIGYGTTVLFVLGGNMLAALVARALRK
ncbi:hypothetical protein [Streptomyces albipurpureus]|uniref:Integral membrane protein n=1 Tax=Streptomyces albipurpureus TaxID=2897419 RepID=A0ABT0UT06_9ACTN|nr:hypothetical protein [Streptomyces sp. CWNU-1]MCM2391729.1 hypothetical protein [Streptomyces sp. CWNU-1]